MMATDGKQSWACSGTIVGPQVYLTAAHCADDNQVVVAHDKSWKAVCSRHPSYKDDDNEHALDISVCKLDRVLNVKPAHIAKVGPELGDMVTMAGYGCTMSSGHGGNNGVLKVGEAPVYQLEQPGDYWYYTEGADALCFGDSGGPNFKHILAPKKDMHMVMGVNSRGDIHKVSMLAPLYIDIAQEFLENYAQSHKVKICGVTPDC